MIAAVWGDRLVGKGASCVHVWPLGSVGTGGTLSRATRGHTQRVEMEPEWLAVTKEGGVRVKYVGLGMPRSL